MTLSPQKQIPAAISPEALFAKSQHFIASALAARNALDVSAFPLSAAIALELLAKAALANKHPSLIVDVKKNENTLFVAAGIPVEIRVGTIGADAAYARMKHLNSRFSENVYKACKALADARNAHLHSGELPFVGSQATWEPDFWYAAELILETMNRTFEDWLGAQGAALSKTVLKEARAAKKAAVSIKLAEYKRHYYESYPSEKQRSDAVLRSESLVPYEVGRHFRTQFDRYWLATCPACGAKGVTGGDHSDTELAEDQDDLDFGWERVVEAYQPGEFLCPTCGLHLYTDDELYFAGVEMLFTQESEREIEWEPDYGND